MVSDDVYGSLPEWEGFAQAVQRWHGQAGPDALRRIRTLLSGY